MRNIIKATAALAAMLASAPAIAAWEPTKPVEIVVAAGAGGASDQMARMMQAAIQKNNLMKQPMVVSLKGGASGAEALMYMKSSDGDPNKVLIAYSLIYMLPLSAKIPFNWRELTPVSVVAMDQFVLWDNAAGPKTVKEFVAAAKAAASPFKMGGTGSKREDHVLTVFMEQKTGAKFSYLPYKSGGEAATQLVGNHTEANVNNPIENLEVWRAGQVRALCVFDKERIAYKTKVTETQSWNDIPTCKEEGLDVQYLMLRAMFLPGKVTPEQTGVLCRSVPEGDADDRVQGLHGKAGAEADLPHRQGHAEIPRGGRQAQRVADERSGVRGEVGACRHAPRQRSASGHSSGGCRSGIGYAAGSPRPVAATRRLRCRIDRDCMTAFCFFRKTETLMSNTEIEIVVEIRPRRRPNSPAVTSTRIVDVVVSLLLLALAVTLGFDNWRTGIAWDSTGPQAGYFPFYLSVILAGASLYGLVAAFLSRKEAAETFVTRAQLRRVMRCSCRRCCSVSPCNFSGSMSRASC